MSSTPPPSTSGSNGEEPVVIERSFNVWNAGGNPEVLRAAAQAWRTMAGHLEALSAELRAQSSAVSASWTGAAADGFRAHVTKLTGEIDDAVPEFHKIAGELDTVANEIQRVNDELHAIYIEIGVTIAAGVALSFVTGFFGSAAAAARAAQLAARGAAIVAQLMNMLSKVATIMRASRLAVFGARFAAGFVSSLTGKVAANVATGKAADDISGADWASFAIGGVAGAGVSHLADGSRAFSRFAGAHPTAAAAFSGAGAGGLGGIGNELFKGTDPRSAEFWRNVGLGVAGGTAGGALGQRAMHAAESRMIRVAPATGISGGGRTIFGPNGHPLGSKPTLYGPNGHPIGSKPTIYGPNGHPIGTKPTLYGPDGYPIGSKPTIYGPNGHPIGSKPTIYGPNGEVLVGASAVPPATAAAAGAASGSNGRTILLPTQRSVDLVNGQRIGSTVVANDYLGANKTTVEVAQGVAKLPLSTFLGATGGNVGGYLSGNQEAAEAVQATTAQGPWSPHTAPYRAPDVAPAPAPTPAPSPAPAPAPAPAPSSSAPTQAAPAPVTPAPAEPGGAGGAGSPPATAVAPPPAIAGGVTHVVAPGDTLSEVAQRYFGDESLWPVIHRANPTIIDPDLIHSGQQLVIPTISRPLAAPVH